MLALCRLALAGMLVFIPAFATTGCIEEHGYSVLVTFQPPELARQVDRVLVTLVETCAREMPKSAEVPATVRDQLELVRDQPLEGLSNLEPGLYGFHALGMRGTSGNCRIASGCQDHIVSAGGRGLITIKLEEIPPVGCVARPEDAGPDTGTSDASITDMDAGTRDADVPLDAYACDGTGTETCNGYDDDCDREIDEDFSLQTNPERCGACDHACDEDEACAAGTCAPRATEIDLGAEHSCALRADGRVLCWGSNSAGQLGLGDLNPRPRPTLVEALGDDTRHIEACAFTSCAVMEDRTVRCWGNNDFGQLGDGTHHSRMTPSQVAGLSDARQLGAGSSHTCAVRTTGQVACWGRNVNGELGIGETSADAPTPQDVAGISYIVQVQGGYKFTCARTSGGHMFCWGLNSRGQLGNGQYNMDSSIPVQVRELSDAVDFAAGGGHVCAIREGGEILCWGEAQQGQLATGEGGYSSIPVSTGIINGSAMSSGNAHVCALLTTGNVACWGGGNEWGHLGNGTTEPGMFNRPTAVVDFNDAVGISMAYGDAHTCAIRANHNVVCWGRNQLGQLGNGAFSAMPHSRPVTVLGL